MNNRLAKRTFTIQNHHTMKPISTLFLVLLSVFVWAQPDTRVVRLAKLVIDSAQLDSYNALLKEGINTAMREEPGVLTLYAVAEKARPNHITILEIYANQQAYESHIRTPHFLKYKNGTRDMVQSLELIDTVPLVPTMKIK